MSRRFVHLRVHSEYSLIDGIVRIKPLIKMLEDTKVPAVALTDVCNLFGLVKFYRAAMGAGIKPIIGADCWVAAEGQETPETMITFLCQNELGYKNLTRLISKAYREGQVQGKPTLKKSWLSESTTKGLIALSGGIHGEISHLLLQKRRAEVSKAVSYWQSLFPGRFYLEISRTGRANEERLLHLTVELADECDLPLVATNDVRFLQQPDYEAHEARVCINQGYTLDNEQRPRNYSEEQYLKTEAEMVALFKDVPEALDNTLEIAKRCTLSLQLGKNYLPTFPIPDGKSEEEYFSELSKEGLEGRLEELFTETERDEKRPEYLARLQRELDVIIKMDFPGYFLVVADFILWAKNNGVPVGPGRGSGAGSLVAYALGITDLDPIEFDLLFERFLNPERVSMPDFDVDFCMEGRDRVIHYVEEAYGRESVCQIITFGTMAAKAVVRDVGRVLGHPYGFVDKIAKLIPFEIGMTLEKALVESEGLEELYHQEDEVKALIDLARKLEGITRNAGKHAGGVVIAPTVLTDFTPLYCEASGDNLVTQLDKDDVEAVGLVKFDFLGLRTLTIIDWALQTVNTRIKDADTDEVNIAHIDKADAKTFELIKAGKTTAVFQLESRGMKELIIRLQPDCFDDIVALVALFRPGPLQSGMVDDFIDRKHGRAKVEYPHPLLEDILKSTYGVILYQEQVMQIAQVLACYSLGQADLLRRAMGKKKPEEMAKQREIFLAGAKKNDVDESTANSIFDLMEKFAGYGFNKSHSVAYALISYQTAWLKAHHPAAFMAAVLSSDMDNTDKVVTFIEESRQMGLKVCRPNINDGEYKFTVADDKTVYYGLGAIKGVGKAVIENIVASRQSTGPFQSLFDFVCRSDMQKLNRRVLEALIKAGSFDALESNRASLLASIELVLQTADQHAKQKAIGQGSLFGGGAGGQDIESPQLISVSQMSEKERLRGEKETLGLYVTGHPLDRYQKQLTKMPHTLISRIGTKTNKSITVVGLLVGIRTMKTRRGRMAFLGLEDRTGRIEIALFSDLYDELQDQLIKDQVYAIEGKVSVDEYTGGYKISASRVTSLDIAIANQIKGLALDVASEMLGKFDIAQQLKPILEDFKGGKCQVMVRICGDGGTAKIPLGKNWRVHFSEELVERLNTEFGQESVELIYE